MKNLRYGLIALSLFLCPVPTATAGISIGIGLPTVSIGINLPVYPELVRVPGYPVYYAPRTDANYFFYDGMYWVYQDDNWYASSWYNGPWGIVGREVVPLYILRVPVRYYRQPPMYFQGWQSNAPPRWGQHWGPGWERDRRGWNNWNRRSAPAPAPLPIYQKRYSGDRYPRVEQQHELRKQEYRYQPKDKAVRQHMKQQVAPAAPAPARQGKRPEPDVRNQKQQVAPAAPAPARPNKRPEPDLRDQKQQVAPHPAPFQKGAPPGPHTQPPQRGGEQAQRTAPHQDQPAPQQRAPAAREQQHQQAPGPQHQQAPAQQHKQAPDKQDKGEAQGEHGQGGGGHKNNDEDRGQGRNR